MDHPRSRACEFGHPDGPVQRHLRCFGLRLSSASLPSEALDHVGCHASRSMRPRVRRKRCPRQVAFGKLEHEIPSEGTGHSLMKRTKRRRAMSPSAMARSWADASSWRTGSPMIMAHTADPLRTDQGAWTGPQHSGNPNWLHGNQARRILRGTGNAIDGPLSGTHSRPPWGGGMS
jgi:hypothetical protein